MHYIVCGRKREKVTDFVEKTRGLKVASSFKHQERSTLKWRAAIRITPLRFTLNYKMDGKLFRTVCELFLWLERGSVQNIEKVFFLTLRRCRKGAFFSRLVRLSC